jgi:uncharacterized membrane protein
MKHSNINKTAMALAHSIKGAYSSFRLALITAYKVVKSTTERLQVLAGLALASVSLTKLAIYDKVYAINQAWLAIYNLEYLD